MTTSFQNCLNATSSIVWQIILEQGGPQLYNIKTTTSPKISMMTRNLDKLRTRPCMSLKSRKYFNHINYILPVQTLIILLLVVNLPRPLEVNISFFVALENATNRQFTTSVFTEKQPGIGRNTAPSSALLINEVVLDQSAIDNFIDFVIMMYKSYSILLGNVSYLKIK